MNNSNPVGWFDIYATNFERAKQFYEHVFNVTLTNLPVEWGKQALFPFNPEHPNISGALVEKTDMVPTSGGTMVYFETDNCLAEEERIIQAGGKIIQSKTSIGSFGFISIFVDSEGNTVGLHAMQQWPMAYDERLANRVREYLAEVPDIEVTEKEMFAMLNFMVNGKTCVCVNETKLMLRFDPQLQEELAAKPGYETMLMKGKPYKGYCYMCREGYTRQGDFVYLMGICLAYNKVIQSAKR